MASADRREREREHLRAKILETARQIIREEGYDALTIRKISARIEYSPMALYNHFADKTAILLALALSVFAQFEEALPKPSKDPLAALRKGLLAYIRFGMEHPDEYQVIFMTRLPADTPSPQTEVGQVPDTTGGHKAFERLAGAVQACIDADIIEGHAFKIATALWAGIHGAVSLQITQTSFPFGSRKGFAETLVNIFLKGVQKA